MSEGPASSARWFALAGAILSEVAATLSLKAALEHPAWYVLVVAGYLAAFAFLSLCLRRGMGIGVAYGIWGAGGVCLTAVLSALFFGEPMTALMVLGLALVVGGVLVVELGSPTPGAAEPVAAITAELSLEAISTARRSRRGRRTDRRRPPQDEARVPDAGAEREETR